MKRPTRFRNERGIALMLCLFALLLLTTIGAGLMVMANTETSVNYNYRSSMQAYYASKAGLEEARERLRFGNAYSLPQPPNTIPSTSYGANQVGLVYILNTPDTGSDPVAPWDSTNRYFDDEFCSEPFNNGAAPLVPTSYGAPCAASQAAPAGSYTTFTSSDPGYDTSSALGYKWVRITLKQNCSTFYGVDGSRGGYCATGANKARLVCADPNDLIPNELTNGIPREKLIPTGATTCESASPPMRSVYLVTSFASSPKGARRMTQYELASTAIPPLPAALTLDGPTPTVNINFPTSNANNFDGNDHGVPGCTTGAAVPAIGTIDTTSNDIVISSLPHPANYIGAGGTPSVQPTPLPALYGSVSALQQLVANITAGADQVFGNNPSGVNLGTDSAPKITVVNGDYNMGNSHAAGVLVVTGTFSSAGNPDFNGIIMVIGKGVVNLGGGGNGAFNGGMLVANIIDSSGNLLSTPGSPSFTWNAGGNFNFNYSSCWINSLASRLPYKIIATREEMY